MTGKIGFFPNDSNVPNEVFIFNNLKRLLEKLESLEKTERPFLN